MQIHISEFIVLSNVWWRFSVEFINFFWLIKNAFSFEEQIYIKILKSIVSILCWYSLNLVLQILLRFIIKTSFGSEVYI